MKTSNKILLGYAVISYCISFTAIAINSREEHRTRPLAERMCREFAEADIRVINITDRSLTSVLGYASEASDGRSVRLNAPLTPESMRISGDTLYVDNSGAGTIYFRIPSLERQIVNGCESDVKTYYDEVPH